MGVNLQSPAQNRHPETGNIEMLHELSTRLKNVEDQIPLKL